MSKESLLRRPEHVSRDRPFIALTWTCLIRQTLYLCGPEHVSWDRPLIYADLNISWDSSYILGRPKHVSWDSPLFVQTWAWSWDRPFICAGLNKVLCLTRFNWCFSLCGQVLIVLFFIRIALAVRFGSIVSAFYRFFKDFILQPCYTVKKERIESKDLFHVALTK